MQHTVDKLTGNYGFYGRLRTFVFKGQGHYEGSTFIKDKKMCRVKYIIITSKNAHPPNGITW